MAKVSKQVRSEQDAFEIIELAVNDLETLTRAFEMISDVCKELENPNLYFDDRPRENLIN